jgi:capsule polysaccharide export protein KpsE/RkpR
MADKVANLNELSVDALEGGPIHVDLAEGTSVRERTAARLRLLWDRRQFVSRLAVAALALSTLIAFLIPKQFESTTRLMPPDQVNSGLAMLATAASAQASSSIGAGLGSVAGDLLGLKSSGALFIGILTSRTVQDDLVNKFDLRQIYGVSRLGDARENLGHNTDISEDRKSGIITIRVTDKNPQRAAAMAGEYVEELNRVVTLFNTSSAHRERVFLEERLTQVKQDLEFAEKGFSEFASKNTTIDIQAQGKAMVEAAAALQGQWITAQTELQGLKQIYSDSNVRVRGLQARVDELQRQLQKLGGKFDTAGESKDTHEQLMYPSIRKLSLLGVSYADLYRSAKVQEAIFVTLRQQYELAKVQEAKETPSVKVIDSPDVPEKKSFPPRFAIMFVGTMLAILFGLAWILADSRWEKIDRQDPQKVLALEIYQATKAQLSGASLNWFGAGAARERFRRCLFRRQPDRNN